MNSDRTRLPEGCRLADETKERDRQRTSRIDNSKKMIVFNLLFLSNFRDSSITGADSRQPGMLTHCRDFNDFLDTGCWLALSP